jgi:hypothetical protein
MGFFKLTAAKASGLGQRHVPTIGVRREVCNKLLKRRVQSKPLLSPKSRPKRERYPSSTAPCLAPGFPPAPQVSPSGRGTTQPAGSMEHRAGNSRLSGTSSWLDPMTQTRRPHDQPTGANVTGRGTNDGRQSGRSASSSRCWRRSRASTRRRSISGSIFAAMALMMALV